MPPGLLTLNQSESVTRSITPPMGSMSTPFETVSDAASATVPPKSSSRYPNPLKTPEIVDRSSWITVDATDFPVHHSPRWA